MFGTLDPFRRRRLLRAARRYASHRWLVVPGARFDGDRFDCDQLGCPTVTCHPAVPDWERTASADPERVTGWWQEAGYGVLLATGHGFDVLEIAGPTGARLAREVPGPVAVAPPHRWMFFVTGGPLMPALAAHPSVVLHRTGSWVPAPPTALPTGVVRWRSRPAGPDWRPADAARTQQAAARLLLSDTRRVRDDHQSRRVWQLNHATAAGPE